MTTRQRIEIADYVRVRHHKKLLPGIWELKSIREGIVTVQRLGYASPRFLAQSETELTRVQRKREAS